jgi:flagellar biosynthesis/type III secretory pathway protein FliH
MATVPMPSWLAPPLPEPNPEDPPSVRVSVPPPEAARLYVSPSPPVEVLAAEPPAPPYPDLRVQCAALQSQLVATAECLTQLRLKILEASEEQLVRLACGIGERIAGRELQLDQELVVRWAKEAIDQLAKDESVIVAISPDVADALRAAAWEPVQSTSVRIETDATLKRGSCEIRGRQSTVDASLASRVEAITREVVGPQK